MFSGAATPVDLAGAAVLVVDALAEGWGQEVVACLFIATMCFGG